MAPSASWPLCDETTALCLSFLRTNADVLNCDRVWRSFRACKAALPSEVLLKGNISWTAWLQNNVDRVLNLQLLVSNMDVTYNDQITAHECAAEVCSALVGARLQKLDISNVPLPYYCRSLSLPDDVFQLTTLQHLGITNMLQQALPSLVQLTGLTSLSIIKCDELASLPEALGQLSRLQDITISDSESLVSLPSSIGALSNLQCLSIIKCARLASLPEAIGQLTSLQLLSVDNVGSMPSLPESLSRLTQLHTLKATGGYSFITGHLARAAPAIPVGAIGKMPSLTRLEMAWRTDSLPDAIGDLSKLEMLVADCATLTALPSTIAFLGSLRVLRLVNCSVLQQLPEALGDLSSLQALELYGCAVRTLPESVGNLTGLRHLSIDCSSRATAWGTAFEGFPASISGLVSLQHLRICDSRMRHLNLAHLSSLQHLTITICRSLNRIQGMEQLVSLEELNMKDCGCLEPLPEECWEQLASLRKLDVVGVGSLLASFGINSLCHLTSLQDIHMQWCELPALQKQKPATASLQSPRSLQRMHLDAVSMEALPAALGKLSCLQELVLVNCYGLKQLPNSLSGLSSLQHLSIVKTPLEELPSNWGNLCALQHCTIDSCKQLTALPPSTSRLTALTELTLSDLPNLGSLPANFGGLAKLQKLSLTGCNKLASLPNRLQRLTSLQELQLQACGALQSLPAGLGKLSLLHTLRIRDCPSLTSIEGTWEDATSLKSATIWDCLLLVTVPERLRQMSGHMYSTLYKGPTGRMYPTNLVLAAGDLRLGSPEYAAAEEEQQEEGEDNPFLVDAVLDEVEVGVTRKRSQEVVQVVKVLVKWKGFELDVLAWEPVSGVRHTDAYHKWAKSLKRRPAWFRLVKPEAAAEAFKAAMKLE